jgi:hypothetical protein
MLAATACSERPPTAVSEDSPSAAPGQILRNPGSPTVLTLGSGEALEILVNPIGLDFGEVQVGSTSDQQVAQVTNVGLLSVVMSGAGGAPGGDFNGSQDCQGTTLAPGESCQMFFTFSPSTAGTATATSAGTWNGQPYSIELRGTGVDPRFQFTPAGVNFGPLQVGSTSVQRAVDVTNIGLASVVMSGAGGAPGGDFGGSQNCQGTTLAPGESCQMFFTFAPTTAGPLSGSSAGSWNGQPYSIGLSGTGVAPRFRVTPSGVDFGDITVGDTSPTSVVDVTNIGLTSVAMSGAGGAPGGDFSGSQNCQGTTLARGESCQMSFTFSPSVVGPASATSTGSWNGQPYSIDLTGTGLAVGGTPSNDLLVTVSRLDFSQVQVGETSPPQEVDIINVSAASVTLSGAGGAPGGDFGGSQDCQGRTLAPGESCQMSFTFSPSGPGSAAATSAGTWNGQPFSIELVGDGVPPQLVTSASALDFGRVQVASTGSTQEVDVTNFGLAPVVMSGAGGAPGGDFSGSQNCQGTTLAPGESCQMSFTFSPTSVGEAMAVSAGSWNGQPYSIDLSGTGTTPTFLITPVGFDFGSVPVGGTSGTYTSGIVNRGLAPVVMSGAGGAPGGDFNGSQDCQATTLAPGESCQISFTFAPTMLGAATATSAGTWNGQSFSIDLMGFGSAPFIMVEVNIMPADDANEINLRAGGSLPVAILTTVDFDAADVDPSTVTLAGAPVVVRGNGAPAAGLEDADGDGLPDLVLHVDRRMLNLAPDATEALLRGETFDGLEIRGVDAVLIVP